MIFSVVYFIIFFSLYLGLLALLWFYKPQYAFGYPKKPVSILIAVRNEEHHILQCLAALEKLNYPPEMLEVLVGDDFSTDGTWGLLQNFKTGKFRYKCLQITGNLGVARGKGNVIAHLAQAATSDYFFITDADIQVPPNWVGAMLSQMKSGVGIVTGITTITGNRLFDRLQAIDWLYSLGLMQVIANLGVPVSTMGNNMLVSRVAYASTGGYEQIPFSITEDVQLFREILKEGYSFVNVFHPAVLAFSTPAPDPITLLHQRKRWMTGGLKLPWYMVVVLVLHASYYPIILPFFLHAGWTAMLTLFGLKLLMQTVFIQTLFRRLNLRVKIIQLLFFELYQLLLFVVLLVFFFLPVRVLWKNRKY